MFARVVALFVCAMAVVAASPLTDLQHDLKMLEREAQEKPAQQAAADGAAPASTVCDATCTACGTDTACKTQEETCEWLSKTDAKEAGKPQVDRNPPFTMPVDAPGCFVKAAPKEEGVEEGAEGGADEPADEAAKSADE